MLVLSRKKNERVIIGEGENRIEVMIVDIRGDKVRLGIQADKRIAVDREEVRRAKELFPRKGLAGAKSEFDLYDHKSQQPPEDDQPLLDKTEDSK